MSSPLLPYSSRRRLRVALSTIMLSAISAAAVSIAPRSLPAQPALPPRIAALDDSIRTQLTPGSPGVAVGIVRDGRVAHTFYAGEADLSHHVPVGPASRFNIASNAKQFTASIVLSLVIEGRLSLDAPVQTLLPDALPGISTPITIQQLLTHTSGVRDVYDLWSLAGTTWWQSFLGNSDALALLRKQRALNFAPGTSYLYSNSNYLLLTAVVALVTDSSFADVSANRFATWGLPQSAFQTSGMQVIPNRTRPYGGGRSWQEYPTVTSLHGDGGLFTTLPDQLSWEQQLQQSAASPRALTTVSQEPVAGASITTYGYGVERGTYGDVPYLFHDGSTGAYNAAFLRFPGKRLAIVVMSNNGSLAVHNLAAQYADALLGDGATTRGSFPSRPARIGPVVDVGPWLGDYRASTGALISLVQTDSGLLRRIPGSNDVRLLPDTGNVYRYASNAELKMALDRDAAGAPRFTIYLSSQLPNVGTRLPDAAAVPTANWLGEYRNEETGSVIAISAVSGGKATATLNGRPTTGTLVRTDLLVVNGYELQPVMNATGAIRALSLRGDRIRNIEFVRVP